jgi:tetratricopeptide (TPR) repeat protein
MSSSLDNIREKLAVDTLIEWYKREVLNDDYPPSEKAVLLYQLGKLEEIFNKDQAEATRYYLLAYKQDNTFVLPVMAAGAVLFSTKSFERLLRLYEMLLDSVTDPALRSSILMFLIESLEAQEKREEQRVYIADLEETNRYPIHTLILKEWNAIALGDEEQAARALEAWKVVTEHPYVRSQLCLELARNLETAGDMNPALEFLQDAAVNARDLFPVMPEIFRMAVKHGKTTWLEGVLIDDLNFLGGGGDPSSRFLLVRPTSGEEASVMLANFMATLSTLTKTPLSEDGLETFFGVVHSAIREGKVPEVLSLLLEFARGTKQVEELEGALGYYLEQPLEPVEKVWLYWNMVKVELLVGKTERAIEYVKEIKKLGYSSRILDSLISLFHLNLGQQDEMLAYMESLTAEGRDLVSDAILCDWKWAFKNDLSSVAETLRGFESLSHGMEDLAYVAAILTDNSFLKEKALQEKVSLSGAGNLLGAAELLKFYAFEWANTDKFFAVAEKFGREPKSFAVWAALLGMLKAAEAGKSDRLEAFLKKITESVKCHAFDPFVLARWAGKLLDLAPGGEAAGRLPAGDVLRSAVGFHSLLGAVRDSKSAAEAGKWILDQLLLGADSELPPLMLIHAARTVQKNAGNQELVAKIGDALLNSEFVEESFPDLSMYLVLKQKDLGRILATLNETTSLFEINDYERQEKVALIVMSAIHAMFVDRDFGKSVDLLLGNRSAGKIDAESMFMLLFGLALTGRWEEWVDVWQERQAGHSDDALGGYEADIERACMVAGLLLKGSHRDGLASADRILARKKGDPSSLIVRLYGAVKDGHRKEFANTLRHIGIWIGEPRMRGRISYHVNHLEAMEGEEPGQEDESLVVPDMVNMDSNTAAVVEGGLINMTDEAVKASLEGFRRLEDKAFKCAALVEMGELLASAARSGEAVEAYEEALKTNPGEIGAILGLIRNARALDDHARLGWALECQAEITPDRKRAAVRFVEAAESYKNVDGKADAVLRCFEKSFELDPSNDKSFHGLIGAIEKKGDIATLIPLIERRVGTISEYQELQMLLLKLADLKRQSRDMEGALIAVEDLLLITPDEAPEKVIALRLKMDLLIQMGRIEKAFDVGSQIIDEAKDRKVRKGIIQKCINLAFQKLNMPERGLKFCLMLIEDGDAEPEFVNKTLRIALKIEKWDEAARIQDLVADTAKTEKEKVASLLKKAEIYLRYAKDLPRAEEEYRKILKADPSRWEALTRWQAARGARLLTAEELAEFIDGAYEVLEGNPLKVGAINTLVRANRILMATQTSRYYEAIMNVLSTATKKIPTPPGVRTSMTMIGRAPSGRLDADDIEGLFAPDPKTRALNGVLRALGTKQVAALLKKEGIIKAMPEVELADSSLPIVKYVNAWGQVFGVGDVPLFTGDQDDATLHGHPDIPQGIVLGIQAVFPLLPDALFKLGFALFNLSQGLWLQNIMKRKKLLGLVVSAVNLCSSSSIDIEKEESFTDILFVGTDEALKDPIISALEGVGPLTHEDVIAWHHRIYGAAMKAGHLVSGKIEGMIAFMQPEIKSVEDIPREDLEKMFKKDLAAKAALSFALSRRYEALRQALGLEL